jgi:GNAT superfamily N-acetyltransferase
MDYTFTLSDAGDEDIRRAIVAPLIAYNESQAGPSGHQPRAVVLRDVNQVVVGGLWGATSYGWLYAQLLIVPEATRGQGLGMQLLGLAEAQALVRGCGHAWLDTVECQARVQLLRGITRLPARPHAKLNAQDALSARY